MWRLCCHTTELECLVILRRNSPVNELYRVVLRLHLRESGIRPLYQSDKVFCASVRSRRLGFFPISYNTHEWICHHLRTLPNLSLSTHEAVWCWLQQTVVLKVRREASQQEMSSCVYEFGDNWCRVGDDKVFFFSALNYDFYSICFLWINNIYDSK